MTTYNLAKEILVVEEAPECLIRRNGRDYWYSGDNLQLISKGKRRKADVG